MKFLFTLLLFTNIFVCAAQTNFYKGFIGKHPIQLITKVHKNGFARAVYSYDKYDTPINISGRLSNDTLTLLQKNEEDKVIAKFQFNPSTLDSTHLIGTWSKQGKRKKRQVSLTKFAYITDYEETSFDSLEIMQNESTDKHYFKLLTTEYLEIIAVRVYEKRTDKLIQDIPVKCQYIGYNNLSVGDFNLDFSVFKESFAGSNTSTIYFIRDANTTLYTESEFIGGNNLDFDYENKRIYEHTSCCAGNERYIHTYKIENDKMILIKETCLKFNREKQDYDEVNCEKN